MTASLFNVASFELEQGLVMINMDPKEDRVHSMKIPKRIHVPTKITAAAFITLW